MQLQQSAIQAALTSDWEKALQINQQIIEQEPENVDAINRTARAYFELGNIAKSKKYYELSLQKDPYNQIAAKFLKKIQAFNKTANKKISYSDNQQQSRKGQPSSSAEQLLQSQVIFSSEMFIEEPGKTKLATLLKVAEPHRLSRLSPGMSVNLVLKNRVVVVTSLTNDYIGALPDDLSMRLIKMIKGGNKYQALIKNIKTNGVAILIREVFRSSKFKNQPSFLDSLAGTHAISSDHIVIPLDIDEPSPSEVEEEVV